MKVKELIKILKKCYPDLDVEIHVEYPRFGIICINSFELIITDDKAILTDTRKD
jgi:hypothetical protein